MRISNFLSAFCLVALLSPLGCQAEATTDFFDKDSVETINPARDVNQLVHQGKRKEALDYIDRELEGNPKNVQLQFMKAVILTDLGSKQEAKNIYEQLIREYPEIADPYNNLAVLYAAEGNTGRARELLETALYNNARSLTTYSNLGDIYLSQAADAYARALKMSPKNQKLKKKLETIRELQK